ncbi:MAG: hypothetical protein ACLPVO_01665 [Desulfomonilaceae bacterium]
MKKFVCVVSLLIATLFCVSVCMADSDIPNLVGTWTVKSEGGLLLKGKEPGPKTNYTDAFGTLNAEAVITKQQGRIIHGSFKSSRATKNFIAAIGLDNKTLYYADEDGFLDGKIIDKDTIEYVYRHATLVDTVIGVGVWTRKK